MAGDETDEALFERVRRGDMCAFDALYARHETKLFGFLIGTLRNREEAEDVFHDAFLAALKSPPLRLEGGGFGPWLFRVARNLCLNRQRSERRGQAARAQMPPPERPATAEDVISAHELRTSLASAVRDLPAPLKEVYHLRASGLSYEEMAAVLEIPLGTLKSRMNQMVTRLRDEVSP